MNTALITGASGFLGKAIIDNLPLEKVFKLSRSNGDIIVDLTLQIPPVQLVVHCAGKAHSVPKTELQKKEFFNVNVTGTANLLKALEKNTPKSFVFISSVSVYGLETGKLITEDSHLLASDPYGKSKVEAEQLVLDWCKNNNIICTILRLPLIAGPNPPGNLKSMINGIKRGYYFNIDGGKAKKV